jgi:hypothetical protein
MAQANMKLDPDRIADLTLEQIRAAIAELQALERRKLAASEFRDAQVLEERMRALLYRFVGFELFDARRTYALPKQTYVAQSGKHVLFAFNDKAQADELIEAALKAVL